MCAEGAPGKCEEQLRELNKALAELGQLVLGGQVNMTGAAPEAAAALGVILETPAEEAACSITVALAPFGEDKGEPAEWPRFSGATTISNKLSSLPFYKKDMTRLYGID